MKNLVIDSGNTTAKVGVYEGSTLVAKEFFFQFSPEHFKQLIDLHRPQQVLFAGVGKVEVDRLEQIFPIKRLTALVVEAHLPEVKIKYSTPETLGADRLAAVLGAYAQYPTINCLCIDVGTCITFDLINAENEYLGGGIHPGISMRYKAMHTFTARLPLIESPTHSTALIGTSTQESMMSGVINGVLAEIEGIILKYHEIYSSLKVIITGGDGWFIKESIQHPCHYEEDLVLHGLNYYLQRIHEKNK